MKFLILTLILSSFVYAQDRFGNLTPEEQKYFQSEAFKGRNKDQRTDDLVREINKMWGEIKRLESKVVELEKKLNEQKK